MAKGLSNLVGEQSLSGGLSYFDYELALGRQVILPWLAARMDLAGRTVGDFGCHQGGVLHTLREAGMAGGFGVDLDEESIRGSPFEADGRFHIEHRNILDLDGEGMGLDLVLMHDVLEHIPDSRAILDKVRQCLAPGGRFFVSFPPYYSPFGGHQQVAANWPKLVPYFHFLPEALFFGAIRLEDNVYLSARNALGDMKSVRETRLSLARAEAGFARAGFTLECANYFLLRPEFRLRYGLPTLACDWLGRLPGLREIATMGVFYLLRKS